MKEYFSHDYNARNDRKLTKLKVCHKMAGLGVYWSVIEMLYEEGGKILLGDILMIADELRTDPEVVESVIEDFDLFEKDNKYFWSESILKRLKIRDEKSQKAKDSIAKRWASKAEKADYDTNVLRPNNERNTIKEKKSKEGKESIKKKPPVFTPPIIEEVKSYFLENGFTETSAIKAFNYYDSASWKDSKGNQVKNWKQKMQGVWFKDEHKATTPVIPIRHYLPAN